MTAVSRFWGSAPPFNWTTWKANFALVRRPLKCGTSQWRMNRTPMLESKGFTFADPTKYGPSENFDSGSTRFSQARHQFLRHHDNAKGPRRSEGDDRRPADSL